MSKKRKDKVYLGVYISESTHAILKQIAEDKESTVSGVVREMIKDAIKQTA